MTSSDNLRAILEDQVPGTSTLPWYDLPGEQPSPRLWIRDAALSHNQFYGRMHHMERDRLVRRDGLVVLEAISKARWRCAPIPWPVILIWTAFQRRQMDSSNICIKSYEDGLKRRVIHDDKPRYVVATLLQSRAVESKQLEGVLVTFLAV